MTYYIMKKSECVKHLCVIDEVNKTVSTTEDGLVFDFGGLSDWSFKTGSHCTFKTGSDCTFKTGYGCTFNTGSKCTFNTDLVCTFKTGYGCTFNTGSKCTFNTDLVCTFNTGSHCTFNTGSDCAFKTGFGCTFKCGEQCVVIRRDIFETYVLMAHVTTKLNGNGITGYVFNRDEYIEKIEVNEEKLAFKLANEEWVPCIQ